MIVDHYWAGGSAERWLVKRRRASPFVGHPAEETLIYVFSSADFTDGERGAARAANLLAERLNT